MCCLRLLIICQLSSHDGSLDVTLPLRSGLWPEKHAGVFTAKCSWLSKSSCMWMHSRLSLHAK